MAKVNRAEKILNRLVSEQKITQCGKDWLTAAIDPFHDNQLEYLEGWPDMECGASVVRCVKKSVQLTCPTAITTNWDCFINMHPILLGQNLDGGSPVVYEYVTRSGNWIFPNKATTFGPATTGYIGGVTAHAVPTGTPMTFKSDGTNLLIGQIELDNEYTVGSGRLIGIGFEVHNTTAEIYKQGTVTVFRMQAENRDPVTMQVTSATTVSGVDYPILGSVTVQQMRSPPQTQEKAMYIQGSRQWEAKDGCYVVGAFCSEENPAYGITQAVPAMEVFDTYEELEGELSGNGLIVQRYQSTINQSGLPAPYNNIYNPLYKTARVHPLHQSGAIFSGLSPQSTLTLNVNFFYESFPGPADKAILVLAKPSCKYDPCVMELYSRLVQELPVGVPVEENGLGDWFLDAASKAAKYIGPALAALPHPIAKGAGMALTYLGDTGQDYVKRQQHTMIQPPNAWEQESGMGLTRDPEFVLNKRVKKIAKKEKKLAKQVQAQKPKKKKINRA